MRAVIAAVNAMLIWGGKVRIISTHNGQANPFNQVILEARTGRSPWRVHSYTFRDAIRSGLFLRVCARNSWAPTWRRFRAWYCTILRSYGSNTEGRDQELFAVPSKGEGVVLPLTLIEARQAEEYRLIQWRAPLGMVDWPETARHAEAQRFCEGVLAPLLASLPKDRDHFSGVDFGRYADRTDIALGNLDPFLARHYPLIVELTDCPVDVQAVFLYFVFDRTPRLRHAIMDANGNGLALAEGARQRYGPDIITELKPTEAWYLANMPPFIGTFAGTGIRLPKHQDLRDDLAMLRRVRGVIRVPVGVKRTGTDGGPRHGDAASAVAYADAASRQEVQEYAYQAVPRAPARGGDDEGFDDDEDDPWA